MRRRWGLHCGLALAGVVACGGVVKAPASDAGVADDGGVPGTGASSSSGGSVVGGSASGSTGGSTSGSTSSSGSSSGSGSGSGSNSSSGDGSGSSSGDITDAANDAPLQTDAPTGACSGATGGACNLTPSNVTACKAFDNGTTTGQSECITCFQQDCPGGTQNLFKYLQNCLCFGGPCTSACAGANDYCQVPGCSANTGCSSGCLTCINQYTASGQTCDTNGGQVGACCNADPLCNPYVADVDAYCP